MHHFHIIADGFERIAHALREAASGVHAASAPHEFPIEPATIVNPIEPATIANAELDSTGIPWDGRIHASTKGKTKAGVWTKLKGVSEEVYKAVTDELRQLAVPAVPAVPPVVAVPAVPPVVPVPAVPPVVAVPVAPPVVAVPLTPYTELCKWLAETDALPADTINQSFAQAGITLASLADNQPAAQQWLDAFKKAAGQ